MKETMCKTTVAFVAVALCAVVTPVLAGEAGPEDGDSSGGLFNAVVDTAINPGNSGGPALDSESGLICGTAFQGDKSGEALGYLIPPDIIGTTCATSRTASSTGSATGSSRPRSSRAKRRAGITA